MKTMKLKVTGLGCQTCVGRVSDALRGVQGVESARVDLPTGEAVVNADDHTDPAALERAVRDAGYDVKTLTQ